MHHNAKECCCPRVTMQCVKTFQSEFKLYRISYYCLYKVCPWCGCEFECYEYNECPNCGNPGNDGDDPDPPQPGFVLFPELLLPTSQLAMFPELAFYP